MKGFQYRWVILDSAQGVIEYFEREEQRKIQKPRGSIPLLFATVCPSDEDSQTFVVNTSQGETLRFKAVDAKERQLWVNYIRAVAEAHTEQASTDKAGNSTLPTPSQMPSLLPVKDSRPVMTNGSNSDLNPRSHRSSSAATLGLSLNTWSSERRHAEPSSPYPSEINLSVNELAVVDPYQQLSQLFRLLDREGNQLCKEIDDLYATPSVAFSSRNPETSVLYRNLLIIKATSQASVKSLKQCLRGLQRDSVISTNTVSTNNSGTPVELSLSST